MTFSRALSHVLEYEGGYVDHPSDPGGATNMGITRQTLFEWRGQPVSKEDVRRLTRKEAGDIYKARYWDKVQGDEWPEGIAFMLFDAAVNHGPARAVIFAQEAVRVSADGVLGPITKRALLNAEIRDTMIEMAARRMAFYAQIRTFPTFGLGWSRRLMATLAQALDLHP